MRRILVVANQTLGGEDLIASLERRLESGPAELWILVAATEAHDSGHLALLGPGGSAPVSIPGGGAAAGAVGEATHHADANTVANRRLEVGLEKLSQLGVPVGGEVGNPDPMHAVGDTVKRHKFDEIVISTLPTGLSRWLHTDLPSRVQRKFDLPVTTVTAQDPRHS